MNASSESEVTASEVTIMAPRLSCGSTSRQATGRLVRAEFLVGQPGFAPSVPGGPVVASWGTWQLAPHVSAATPIGVDEGARCPWHHRLVVLRGTIVMLSLALVSILLWVGVLWLASQIFQAIWSVLAW